MARDKSWRLLHHICFLSAFSCGLANSVLVGDDAYYANLRGQLRSEYGLTGGTWLIGGTERATLSSVFAPEAVAKEIIAVERKPFTHAIRLTTTTRPRDSHTHFVHFPTGNAVEKGDVLLLIVWGRGIHGERGRGFVRHTYEPSQPPFTSLVSQEQILASDWQQWLIPFQVTQDMSSSWYKVHLGFQAQTVELGGVAVLNFANKPTVADRPQSTFHFDYDGRDPRAPWRAEAEARIERHRKAGLRIRVVDRKGRRVKGADVEVSQQRHAFGFGTSAYVPQRATNQFKHTPDELAAYYERLEDLTGDGRGFNMAVSDDELRWQTWEKPFWPPYKADVGQPHTLDFIQWLRERDFRVRGHMLVWPAFGRCVCGSRISQVVDQRTGTDQRAG